MTILHPYIYRHTPYRPPPLYQGLGSRVLQGHRDPGSRVTMGYRVTMVTGLIGSQGHWVIRSITRVFSMGQGLHGHHGLGSRVTMGHRSPWSQGYHHHGLGSYSYWVSGHRVSMVTGSHGYHGHRVTHHPGDRISHHPGYRVTMVTGLLSPLENCTFKVI